MSVHVESAAKTGGYSFGIGEIATVANGDLDNFPTQAPLTPVICDRLVIGEPTLGSAVSANFTLESLRLDEMDMDKPIGADDSGPWELFRQDSVINPRLGFYADQQSVVTVTVDNTDTVASITSVRAVFRAAVALGGAGIELAKPAGQKGDLGTGRFINLGANDASTGQARSGTPQTAETLALYHICIQAEADDLLVSRIAVDDDDYLTGGTMPATFFRRDGAWFSFGGRTIDRTNTVRLTTTSGTSGAHAEALTAYAKGRAA